MTGVAGSWLQAGPRVGCRTFSMGWGGVPVGSGQGARLADRMGGLWPPSLPALWELGSCRGLDTPVQQGHAGGPQVREELEQLEREEGDKKKKKKKKKEEKEKAKKGKKKDKKPVSPWLQGRKYCLPFPARQGCPRSSLRAPAASRDSLRLGLFPGGS